MSNEIDAKRIREIQERCDKATPGPWSVQKFVEKWEIHDAHNSEIYNGGWNKDFVEHARQDVPDLLSALTAAQATIAEQSRRLEEARELEHRCTVAWCFGLWVESNGDPILLGKKIHAATKRTRSENLALPPEKAEKPAPSRMEGFNTATLRDPSIRCREANGSECACVCPRCRIFQQCADEIDRLAQKPAPGDEGRKMP